MYVILVDESAPAKTASRKSWFVSRLDQVLRTLHLPAPRRTSEREVELRDVGPAGVS